MAKKYTIKKTDNLLELSRKFGTSPSNILKVNGLQTLTPGQTINVPVLRGFDGVDIGAGHEHGRRGRASAPNNAPSALQQIGAVYSNMTPRNLLKAFTDPFTAPSGNGSRRPSKGGNVNPMLAQNPFLGVGTGAGYAVSQPTFGNLENPFLPSGYVPINFPTSVPQRPTSVVNQPGFIPSQMVLPPTAQNGRLTGGSLSGDKQGQLASSYYGSPSYMNPLLSTVTTGGSLSGDKQGITPALTTPAVSRAEGKAQFLSGEGVNPNSGYIPTRADVWNMKANSRLKKMSKSWGDDEGSSDGGYSSAVAEPVVDPTLQNQGNYVNNAVSWRVG